MRNTCRTCHGLCIPYTLSALRDVVAVVSTEEVVLRSHADEAGSSGEMRISFLNVLKGDDENDSLFSWSSPVSESTRVLRQVWQTAPFLFPRGRFVVFVCLSSGMRRSRKRWHFFGRAISGEICALILASDRENELSWKNSYVYFQRVKMVKLVKVRCPLRVYY